MELLRQLGYRHVRRDGGHYISVDEPGFAEKFCNCLNERYWQFTGRHIHVQEAVKSVRGGRAGVVRGWSRRYRRGAVFRGLAGRIALSLERGLRIEEVEALALARYGVGRYKSQGLGAMLVRGFLNE